jgi:hypothetical protein
MNFQIPKVHGQAEVDAIVGSIRAIPGVKTVIGDHKTKLFAAQWSDPATWDQIANAITQTGFVPKYR